MSGNRVLGVLRVSRTVTDLARAARFHCDALGFRVVAETTHDTAAWGELMGVPGARGRSATLRLGAQLLELVAFDRPGQPYPPFSSSADLWFQHIAIVVSDMGAAYEKLCCHSFEPISLGGPQQLPPSSGSVTAYKFRDPDGHPLELIQFPAGVGNAAWQKMGPVFLGIDHSAIDVADLRQSVDFYTCAMGLNVASRSINSGSAQRRLDGSREDVVAVVALQPVTAGPPHVELLAYRKPRGRPIPQDARSDDIVADRLVLQVDNLAHLTASLRAGNVEFVSPRVVAWPTCRQAVLIRDPTGHLLLLST